MAASVKQVSPERTYSPQEVAEFLSLLELPLKYRDSSNLTLDVDFLTTLHTHMISTVPYETLSLHYSVERTISLDPQHMFQKIVRNKLGRGGYCLENNLLFLFMLRDLGFSVYSVGAKSQIPLYGPPTGTFQGWGHMVLIVTLEDGSRWMIDVCFGGDGPTHPMLLVEGVSRCNMGTQDARLIRDLVPGQSSHAPDHKLWHYQCRNSESLPWRTFYCFSDTVEWLPADISVVNCFAGTSMDSGAVTTVRAVKFLRRVESNCEDGGSAEGREIVFGKRMLIIGQLKENLGGRTAIVKECQNETERVETLRDWLGIRLTDEERLAIKGHATELT